MPIQVKHHTCTSYYSSTLFNEVVVTMFWFVSCRATEDVFTALEDHQVQLSTMKASRFVKAFEMEVDKWERTLSHILEVVEMLLTVQRQWMYLEVSQRTDNDLYVQLAVWLFATQKNQ